MAIRLPIEPEGTKSAASRAKISAARCWRRFIVGSSPYTSSPTMASAMARRISGVGLVTVSLRRSATNFPADCGSASLVLLEAVGPDIVLPPDLSGQKPNEYFIRYGNAGGR